MQEIYNQEKNEIFYSPRGKVKVRMLWLFMSYSQWSPPPPSLPPSLLPSVSSSLSLFFLIHIYHKMGDTEPLVLPSSQGEFCSAVEWRDVSGSTETERRLRWFWQKLRSLRRELLNDSSQFYCLQCRDSECLSRRLTLSMKVSAKGMENQTKSGLP